MVDEQLLAAVPVSNRLPIQVFAQDESRLGLHTIRRRRITAKGIKRIGTIQHDYTNCWVYGCIAPTTGEHFFLLLPTLKTDQMQLFLDEFARAHPTTFNLLVLDNGGAHTAKCLSDELRIFSSNLEDMSTMFPEVTEATQRLRAHDAIFEGEVLAYNPATEEFLPFQQTTRRWRKHGVDKLAAELPLRLFIFDLLYLNGADLTPLPYSERRKQLQALVGETDQRGVLAIAPAELVREPAALVRWRAVDRPGP